jgi:hypothetical protein
VPSEQEQALDNDSRGVDLCDSITAPRSQATAQDSPFTGLFKRSATLSDTVLIHPVSLLRADFFVGAWRARLPISRMGLPPI